MFTAIFLFLFIIGFVYISFTLFRIVKESRTRQLLEKELDIARTIQKSFLPEDTKGIPTAVAVASFMQPARFVGGDLYDIVSLDDGKLGVFIGDVSGKGVPASLIMAQAIALFRVFSHQHLQCSSVLSRLNKELCGQKFAGRFITSLYMIVDNQKRKIKVSSAGHGPLFIYKKRDGKIHEVNLSTELPLGITEEVEYKEIEADLEEGDRVIIFTDGLPEARNKRGEEFGIAKIRQIILENAEFNPQKILESIKEELSKFSNSSQHDDSTLIVFSLWEQR
ncbi:MAG: serine/threonine-protein phosphatase [Candidatus Omnitrophica bacterium]|nr:serine/threonine-protein phosphatase [Candidatus Omnitrophota bacterium]